MHLGIIPDGNRRFCREHGIPYSGLVEYWMRFMIRPIISYVLDNMSITVNEDDAVVHSKSLLKDIQHLSVYLLSSDNMCRQDGSQELGFDLMRKLYQMRPSDFNERIDCALVEKILKLTSFTPVGELHRLPRDIQDILQEFRTKCTGTHFTVTIAIAYDGSKDALGLYGERLQPDVDLVFRSGREQRLSGFFPRQTMYSELLFSDKLWPSVCPEDFEDAVREFGQRQRRFGK